MFKNVVIFISFTCCFNLYSCQTKELKEYQKKDVEILNAEIKSNKDIQYDHHKIALYYYSTLYENFNIQETVVNMNWTDDLLHVELIENNLNDVDIDSTKVVLIFDRPMGIYTVREIRHSWKCKNADSNAPFSAENCK